jgi:hypothetical protein
MSARCIAIADAVAAAINAYGILPPGVVASRRLFVEWDERRDELQVTVIPGARDLSEGTRARFTDETTVQVGFRQRVADDAAAEAVLELVERVVAAISQAGAADSVLVGMDNDVLYDYEALKSQRLLTTLLVLRFRGLA